MFFAMKVPVRTPPFTANATALYSPYGKRFRS